MNDDVRRLATELAPEPQPGDSVYLRRGVVTAVNRTTNKYTLTLAGASIPDVPAYSSVFAVVGDNVDVVFDDSAPRIVGVVGATVWTAVSFQNSWANYGGGYHPVAYSRDTSGMVSFRGLAKDGTMAATMFTLPTGFRPASNVIVPTVSNGVFTYLTIYDTGLVVAQNNAGSSNAWVSLDSARFQAG